MINLIKTEEKRKNEINFYLRLASVLFFALGACFIVASIALLPAYFSTIFHKEVALQRMETRSRPASDESIVLTADLGAKIKVIKSYLDDQYSVSKNVIQTLIDQKSSNIKITEIKYDQNSPSKIAVRGMADTREALRLFKEKLDGGTWSKVDVPISNFVKESNIEFNLTLFE